MVVVVFVVSDTLTNSNIVYISNYLDDNVPASLYLANAFINAAMWSN